MSRNSEEQHPVEINTELKKKEKEKVKTTKNSAHLLGETIVTSVWKVNQPLENTSNWHI